MNRAHKLRLERTALVQAEIARGKTQTEVAHALGISRQAVNQLIHRDKLLERIKRYKAKIADL